jgi:hypothetical protein
MCALPLRPCFPNSKPLPRRPATQSNWGGKPWPHRSASFSAQFDESLGRQTGFGQNLPQSARAQTLVIRHDDARVWGIASQDNVASALAVHDKSHPEAPLPVPGQKCPLAASTGRAGGQLEVFSSRFGRNGVAGGYAVFNVEICRLPDVPRHFFTGVTLGHTPGQCRHRGDISAVCLLLKHNRIAHGENTLHLHDTRARPGAFRGFCVALASLPYGGRVVRDNSAECRHFVHVMRQEVAQRRDKSFASGNTGERPCGLQARRGRSSKLTPCRAWKTCLEMRQDTEEIFRGRVAIRPEHAHQAVGGQGSRLRKLPETDCGVDVVANVLRRIARPVFSSPESMSSIASQSNALRNFDSCCARSRIVSRKSLVSAIAWFPLSLPLLVVTTVRNRLACRLAYILLQHFDRLLSWSTDCPPNTTKSALGPR